MATAKKTAAPKVAAVKTEVKKAAAEKAAAVKTTVKRIAAPKLNIMIQSPMGGVITPEEIMAKVPKEARDVYVRVDENKLYWVGEEDVGSVNIW